MVDAVTSDALVLLATVRIVKVLINLAHLNSMRVAATNVDGHTVSGSVATDEGTLGYWVTAMTRHPLVIVSSGAR